MLITVTAAASTIAYLTLGSGAHAESLFVEPGNVRTLLTMG